MKRPPSLGRFCRRVEVACIDAIDNLAGDDQLVFVVNDALDVVARNGLVALTAILGLPGRGSMLTVWRIESQHADIA
jgi:hypothetical protein